MKYIQHLEDIALSIPNFPYTDLEVDYAEENGRTIAHIFYTDVDGHTKAHHLADMPSADFEQWVFSKSAERFVKMAIAKIKGGEDYEG